ncbi:formyltransferase family protein [Lysinibacillus sp. NPDC056185]|uniref:formyltransferase family protein n=1 Tax=Lysinibacillus sp. NPDC056185 TaxID=3345739 RepID=UPI0039F048D4
MKILYIGPFRANIIQQLKLYEDEIIHHENRLSSEMFIDPNYDIIISYGYRHIIPKVVTDYYKNRIVNLHISYLPWNRGADPNFWSFIDNTKKGVTIHFIDEGIDTGDIILQKEVKFNKNETLRTSYEKLSNIIEELFIDNWYKIRNMEIDPVCQIGKGTYHSSNEKERYAHLLVQGWDTKVKKVEDFKWKV